MIDQEHVLSLIKIKGPVVPMQIAKEIKQDSLMTSAILSQLVDTKKLKISKLKVGGSPLYYLAGQEQRLQSYAKHLEEKDQRTLNLLRNQKILRDDQQQPLVRVSLRQIKDFAIPLQVTVDNQQLLFWKWYLVSDEEATPLIRTHLEPPKPESPIPEKPVEKKKEVEKVIEKTLPKPVEKPKSPIEKPQPETKRAKKKTVKKDTTDFLQELHAFFRGNDIRILNTTKIRKTEFDFELEIPSAMGNLRFYCKAVSKSRINEKDLSEVLVRAQLKRLPGILLSPGDLTKKAQEMLSREIKGLTVTKL